MTIFHQDSARSRRWVIGRCPDDARAPANVVDPRERPNAAPPQLRTKLLGLFRPTTGLCSAALFQAMQRGQRSPSPMRRTRTQQVWLLRACLLRALALCVFGWVSGTANVAFAATSVPMCSSYSECAEAPIPEAPPTGGEMRAPRQNPFEVGPL